MMRDLLQRLAWSLGFRFGAPSWDRMIALGVADPGRATWAEVDAAKRRELARRLDLPDAASWKLIDAALLVDNARLSRRLIRNLDAMRDAASRPRIDAMSEAAAARRFDGLLEWTTLSVSDYPRD